MPFIPTPNGIQVEMRYSYLGERCENVFWTNWTGGSPPAAADLSTIGELFWEWWDAQIKPIQSANATLREIYVTDQSAADGAAATFTAGLPADGGNVLEPLPGNVSLCISLRTAKRGRSFRGRSYIIGLTENQVAGNALTAPSAAAWLAAYDVLVSSLAASSNQLCVCSKFSLGLPRAAGILTPVTDAVIVDNVVDSQRRRLPGRGSY